MKFSTSLILLLIANFLIAQDTVLAVDTTVVDSIQPMIKMDKKIQPKVMVIPYTNGDTSIGNELRTNDLARLAISNVKEAFDKRNFPTVDLNAKLRMIQNDEVMELENQTSIKQELIELSGADMYIETETTINRGSGGNSVTVILSAFDAYTGVSLANKSGVSPRFYTDSFEKLVDKAVGEMIDDFMNTLQLRFDDINTNGRMLAMNITFSEASDYSMDHEYDDLEMLSDKIEDWFVDNSLDSYYHVQGVTATKMIIDEIRVPLLTEDGKNFRVSKFVQKFRRHLKSLGLTTSRDLQGGRIFITID